MQHKGSRCKEKFFHILDTRRKVACYRMTTPPHATDNYNCSLLPCSNGCCVLHLLGVIAQATVVV